MTASPPAHIVRIEPIGQRGLRVRMHLDRGDPVEVALEALERARLGVGDALEARSRIALADADAEVRIRDAALNLLSYRARTRRELERKLRAKGFEAPRIEACMDRLRDRGLLDDAAVSAAFVRDRLRHRPKGRSALRAELRAKGVDGPTADDVVDEVFQDEEVTDRSLAEEVAEAWVRRQGDALLTALVSPSRSPDQARAQRRLRGYLGRRGFRGEALRAGVAHAHTLAGVRD